MNDKAIALLERLIRLEERSVVWFNNLCLKDDNPHSKTVKVLYHILTIMKLYKEMQDDE